MSSEAVLKKIQAPVYPLTFNKIIDKRAPLFLVALFGTTLAYFEFAIYGFLTPILAHHFFPTDDPTVSLLKAFGVFAVGSLAKPIGALIFGYLGDTQGRSITLRYTMIGVAIPTFIVGILPGYYSWGWVAVAILILCRMFQGIFMAGESDGVRIYIFEHFGHKRPCLISACISCSAYTGIALATFVAMQIPTEGDVWRWVFFASSACGILIYTLRRHLIETPPFLRLQQNPQPPIPLKNIVRSRWPSLLRTIMICGTVGGVNHFYFFFQGTYLSKVLNLLTLESALQYSMYLITLYVLTFPIAGWVADKWGYAKVGKIGGIITLSLAIINLLIIKDEFVSLPIMVLTTISMAFFVVPAYLFLTQQYDVNIRFRSFSLGHAIGSTLFSGTGPVICLFLWQITGLSYVPFIYFSLLITMGVSAFIWRARSNAYNAWFL
ncbi:MAG: MFS transporter [Alphaproteobacteria bacterium]|nr:MFS transporter [Alphaproteobacteria bacterium]